MSKRSGSVCEVGECFTSAIYAFPDAKGRARCGQHKEKGMIMIAGHTCEIEGCSTAASFGRSLSDFNNIRCSAHKEEGMVSRYCCKMDGCTSRAYYGYSAGTGRRTSCKKHKENGMVYTVRKGDG
jgi:hypothetical protein